jgi:hypothetical protein
MGTLAYDPERLQLLATALRDAADALDAMQSGDPDAQAAIEVARQACDSCDAWAGTALALAGCNVLEGYDRITIERGDLDLALQRVLANGYGWTITTDPLGATWFAPPVMQAAALGRTIASGWYEISTTEGRQQLLAQLQQARGHPPARQALLANATLDDLAELAIRLGDERAVLVATGGGPPGTTLGGDDRKLAQVATIDAIFTVLGAILIDPTAPLAEAQATLARMRPFAAALVVANLAAPDGFVQPLAIDAFTRYHAALDDPEDPAAWWERPDPRAAGVGEILFPRIARMPPQLAHGFVTALADLDLRLLTHTVNDPATMATLVTTATDPAAISAADAGAVIVPLLHVVRGQPGLPMPANIDGLNQAFSAPLPHLGAIIAPWLMQFAARSGDWGWSKEEAADAFRFVIEDEDSWARLLEEQARWGDSIVLLDGDDIGDLQQNLVEIATMMGALGELLAMRAADRARSDRVVWDLFVDQLPSLINKAIGKAGVTALPAKVTARAVGLAVSLGARQAEEHGVAGAPPPLGDVLRQLDLDQDEAMAVGAYLAMGIKIEALIDAGELPADTGWPPEPVAGAACPSGDYVGVTEIWLTDNIIDDRTRAVVGDARGAFIGGGQSAGACIRLTVGG